MDSDPRLLSHCLSCGRETDEPEVFCAICQQHQRQDAVMLWGAIVAVFVAVGLIALFL